jgi:cytochrome c556
MSSKLRLAALALGLSVLATGAFAQAPEIAQRQDRMKAVGAAVGQIAPVMRNEQPWNAATMGQAAGAVATNLTAAKALYPAGSTHANSRALPAIWERKAEFDGFMDRSVAAAQTLAQAAAAGNEAGFRAAFPALGQSCGACHTPFRRPQS